MSRAAAAALVALSLAAAAAAAAPALPADVRFLAVGDWGGQSDAPFTTPGEVEVAAQMGRTAAATRSQFVLAVGDNFYHDGVKSVDDPRWQSTFEDVFTAESLRDVPFYPALGNHDYHGNVSAQLAYSARSSRWTFPARYYAATRKAQTFSVLLAVLDTNTLKDGDAEQLAWLEGTLARSTADWIIVAGHHPVYSAAEHGPTLSLIDTLLPVMEKYGVAAYVCGHDHDMAHYHTESPVDFLHSGAGHLLEYSLDHLEDIPGGSMLYFYPEEDEGERQMDDAPPKDPAMGAFASVRINGTTLQADYVSSLGKHLYSFSKGNPRAPPAARRRGCTPDRRVRRLC